MHLANGEYREEKMRKIGWIISIIARQKQTYAEVYRVNIILMRNERKFVD